MCMHKSEKEWNEESMAWLVKINEWFSEELLDTNDHFNVIRKKT